MRGFFLLRNFSAARREDSLLAKCITRSVIRSDHVSWQMPEDYPQDPGLLLRASKLVPADQLPKNFVKKIW